MKCNPSTFEHNFSEQSGQLTITGKGTYQYVSCILNGDKKKYFFVKLLDNVEPASTKRGGDITIDKRGCLELTNNPTQLRTLQFGKLSQDKYAYIPDGGEKLKTLISKLSSKRDENAIRALQAEWEKLEKVELTKELDRTDIFFKELKDKVEDLQVIHEYGSKQKDSNLYSPCGQSKIDIVLFRNPKQRQEEVYVAGAVMEMKTGTTGTRLTPSNEAQTAYEMLKLGTDMAIKDKLSRGENVKKVIVYGILVNMKHVNGLFMMLEIDFKEQEVRCYKNSKGTMDLATAFQLIRETLLKDD